MGWGSSPYETRDLLEDGVDAEAADLDARRGSGRGRRARAGSAGAPRRWRGAGRRRRRPGRSGRRPTAQSSPRKKCSPMTAARASTGAGAAAHGLAVVVIAARLAGEERLAIDGLRHPLGGEAVADDAVALGEHRVRALAQEGMAEGVLVAARRPRGAPGSRARSARGASAGGLVAVGLADQGEGAAGGELLAEDARRAEQAPGRRGHAPRAAPRPSPAPSPGRRPPRPAAKARISSSR